MYIQDYSDYLQGKYSASTIHSYLAAVCGFYNVPMDLIAKPIRHTAEYTKSRSDNGKKIRADNNIDNPRYERSVAFQRVVGIIASELAKLLLRTNRDIYVFSSKTEKAAKEIKESDSKTALTERGLRRLVEEKKIVSTLIGNRNLIDMDQLYDYLSGKNRS